MNDQNNAGLCHTGIAELLCECSNDFRLVLIPFYAEIIAAECTDQVRRIRFSALREVQRHLVHYQRLGIVPGLLCAIARKKGEIIWGITTKAEMERVAYPHVPYYDGNKFIPDKYCIPVEEMICWSETSLRAPLNEAGSKRYMELFAQIFPEVYTEVMAL